MTNIDSINYYVDKINNLEINFKDLPKEIQEKREVALAAVRKNPFNYEFLSEEFKNSKSFTLECIGAQWDMVSYLNPVFRSDKEVMLLSIKDDPTTFMFASDDLKNDREIALFAAKCGADLVTLKKYNDDREIALECLKQKSSNILNLSQRLRNELDVVLIAVEKDSGTILYAGQKIKDLTKNVDPKDFAFTIKKEMVRLEMEQLKSELTEEKTVKTNRMKI